MTTHIYEEDMDTISHGDDAAMMSAIDAAIGERNAIPYCCSL